MAISLTMGSGIVSIIFGILVLAFPKLLRYLIGFYFLIIGLIQILF